MVVPEKRPVRLEEQVAEAEAAVQVFHLVNVVKVEMEIEELKPMVEMEMMEL